MHITDTAPIESLIESIGKSLETRAKQVKLTRTDISRMTGLNRNTVSAALAGDDIRLSSLLRILRALGHMDTVSQLLTPPKPTPLEKLAKSGERSPRRQTSAVKPQKPKSRVIGRKKEDK